MRPMSPPAGLRLARVREPDGRVRVAIVQDGRLGLLDDADVLAVLERGDPGEPSEHLDLRDPETLDLPEPWELLAPLDPPETWAAGVTYEISLDARRHESEHKEQDFYGLVYDAERPEIFLKDAAARRTVGPRGTIAVRSDSNWTVPEPEIALVLGSAGTPVAVTIGNDVSSRDIEGANPLYLPQAKVYARACALGPAVLVPEDWDAPFTIGLRISDEAGATLFEGETSTARMKRSFAELVDWLHRDNAVPAGSVLLTGTGLVPPEEYTIAPGHTVEIAIPGIGRLVNPVGTTG